MSFEDWPADIETLVDEKAVEAIYNNESFIRDVAETVVDEADIDGRVQEYLDNNLDISDQVEEALRWRTFESDDIEDFDSRVEWVLEGKINEALDEDSVSAAFIQRLEAVEADNKALRETLEKVAKVLTGEATTASFSEPVRAFEEVEVVGSIEIVGVNDDFMGAAI